MQIERKSGQNEWSRDSKNNWQDSEPRNEMFEKYYKELGLLNENEWDLFMTTLATPLPTTFRFTGNSSVAAELKDFMVNEYFKSIEASEIDGEKIPVPEPLPWYPNNLGWNFDCPRSLLRKSTELSKFHQFLMHQTEVGNVSRQEAVSMIPCLFLDVQPSHYVLDMCAAPGSKTAQLIEFLHDGNNPSPSGLVIANDADYQRSHTLVHQAKRLNSPCLIVTNHDASKFPNIHFNEKSDNENKPLQFDRILCDVPCSGDGTLRKNKPIWNHWNINQANSLHRLQLQILERGIQMLKVGGRLVYSTCSFNPVENEAVVAEMLRRGKDAIELVDVRGDIPELKSRSAIPSWKVMDREGNFYERFEDIPVKEKKRLPVSIFPQEDMSSLGLDRCMRFYPFLQNTGGFFVAVFQKNKEYKRPEVCDKDISEHIENLGEEVVEEEANESGLKKRKSEEIISGSNEGEEQEQQPSKVPRNDHDGVNVGSTSSEDKATMNPYLMKAWDGKKENPIFFVKPEHPDVQAVIEYFNFTEDMPKDQFMVRSDSKVARSIYFMSEAAKKVLGSNNINRIKLVNAGLKLFTRNDGSGLAGCPYRVANEGIDVVSPYFSETRIICPEPNELRKIMTTDYVSLKDCSQAVQDRLEQAPVGCIIFKINVQSPEYHEVIQNKSLIRRETGSIYIPGWKGRTSINTLVNKQEKTSLFIRIFGEQLMMEPKLEAKQSSEVNEAVDPTNTNDSALESIEEAPEK